MLGRRSLFALLIGLSALSALFALGCDTAPPAIDAGPADGGLDAGPSCTELLWRPEGGDIYMWPDPEMVVDDSSTDTGHRIFFDTERFADAARRLSGFGPVFTEDLAELDGFGINADLFFTFGLPFDAAMLPSGDETAAGDRGLGLVVVEPGPPRIIPVSTFTSDEGRTIFLRPLFPLPEQATVAAYVTSELAAAAGGCLQASEAVRALVESPSAEVSAALSALAEVGAVPDPSALVALDVFPTQSVRPDAEAVAEDIESRDYALVGPPTCTDRSRYRECVAAIDVFDYRDEDGVFRRAAGAAAEPVASYRLPLTFWLPLTGEGPFPTLVYGHGLSGERSQGARVADFAAPLGVAVVAAPALEHGEHPTANPEAADLQRVMDFFAIGSLRTRAVHAARLRDNFRQSTWDRHQLVRMLLTGPDIDGDGRGDIDPTRLGYLGVSLGGLMGPQLLATTDDLGVGVLIVPGGKVGTIVSESEQFGPLILALRPSTATEGDVARFFPVLQTAIDRGDAASYGPVILASRLPIAASRTPSVILGMALDDSIVPNVSNFALGRAMGVPIVEPLLRPEDGYEVVTGPLSGNFAEGLATGGYLQFDRVLDGGGGIEAATHGNLGDSEVGLEAWFHFLFTHWDDGLAEIRDPYAAIGFPE